MEAKFTPGPWAIHDNGHYFDIGKESEDYSFVFPTVCIGVAYGNKSDARLISCAPEMYEMLESIKLDINKRITALDNSYMEDEMLNRLKGDIDKLLAKARGEQCD